jgi:hypothetical protein
MGLQSSTQYYVQPQQERTLNAAKNYHQRVRDYNYAFHGSYHSYVRWCHAKYQLECTPEICLHGPNYRPQYDHYGNQVY